MADTNIAPKEDAPAEPVDPAELERVKQRKQKKINNKRKRAEEKAAAAAAEKEGGKRASKRAKTEEASEPSGPNPAIEYLLAWKNDHDSWKFQKVKEIWLLKHVFDLKQIDDAAFKILLKYFKKAPEGRRKLLKKEAKKKIKELKAEAAKKRAAASEAAEGDSGAVEEIPEDPVLTRAKKLKKKMKKTLKD